MAPSRSRRGVAWRTASRSLIPLTLPAFALLLLALGPVAGAPPASRSPSVSEELQVTSVDLWVEVAREGIGSWLRGEGAAAELDPASFELRVDARVVEIAGIATAAEEPAPHRIVVFFDAVTSDQASFRWGASRLAERAAELTALGEVEVVVADPDPRVTLPATRDGARVAEVLSGLALFAGTDAAVPLLRDEFLATTDGRADVDFDGSVFLEEETALVLRRQDLVLRHLIDSEPSTRAGRVLIYVSQGFDPRPEEFYLGGATAEAPTDADVAAEGPLAAESRAWMRALAAHGWTCLPLIYEDRRALLRRGFRIGKWRFHRPGGDGGGRLVLMGASYEGERDAEAAEALVELADGALGRGEYAAAADAYLRAIHHFYGDPRTRERQAHSWRQLALALRGSGELDRARWAMANAIELDPALEASSDAGLTDLAALARDVEGLAELAHETGGAVLRDGESLVAVLDAISRRQRFTFALEGPPTGRVLPLELSSRRGGAGLRFSRWTRSGTPERVAAARLRLFVASASVEPDADSELALRLAEGEESGAMAVAIALERLDPARPARVMIGVVGEETSARIAPLAAPAGGAERSWEATIELGDEIAAAALYVEDLASGEWSVEPVTVEPR